MEVTGRLAALCSELIAEAPHPDLLRLASRVSGPLQVAVAGRLNSGKSTIVNALIGERIAAVDNTECTRLVTSYRYGAEESVVVEHADGETERLSLDADHQVPTDLGIDPTEIRRLTVTLSNAALRSMTLIDTPGTQTLSPDVARSSATALGLDPAGEQVVGDADVTLYLLTGLREADLETLQAHRRDTSPATCLGLLSKADRLEATEPWVEARKLAARFSAALQGLVWDVEPVIGLAAETAECGRITEDVARSVRNLLDIPASELERQLLSAESFVTKGDAIERQRLVDLFDLYGLRRLLVHDRISGSAVDYVEWLRSISNISAVRTAISTLFGDRADLMKATRAMAELRRLAYGHLSASQSTRILDELDRLAAEPALHSIKELELLNRLRLGSIKPHDENLRTELERLLRPGAAAARLGLSQTTDRPALMAAASEGATRWRRIAAGDLESLPLRRAAATIERSYRLLEEGAR